MTTSSKDFMFRLKSIDAEELQMKMKASLLLIIIFSVVSFSIYADVNTDLIEAVKNNQTNEVKRLIEAGADVNTTDVRGDTPLIKAAYGGNFELTKLLLDLGADIHASSDGGHTSLHGAALNGDEKLAELLIDAGADPEASTIMGLTPLLLADRSANPNIVRLLVQSGAWVWASLNDTDVRIRTHPTTGGSTVIGNLNKGQSVRLLAVGKEEERIGNMSAPWLKIQTLDGLVGYSYGHFFVYNESHAEYLPKL